MKGEGEVAVEGMGQMDGEGHVDVETETKVDEGGEACVSLERNVELVACNEVGSDGMLLIKMMLVVSASDIGTMKADVSKE